MVRIRSCYALFFIPLLFGLAACGSSGSGESLNLAGSFSLSLASGDTSTAAVAVLKSRDFTGRLQTNNAYTDFYLTSGDTTVARIYHSRQIIGVNPGTATVTAYDNASNLISPAYTFTVTVAP